MKPSPSDPRRARARRLYELGQARSAALTALVVLPVIGCALCECDAPVPVVVLGAALYLLAAALLFRGRLHGAAVGAGLVAGLLPMLAPLVLRRAGHACIDTTCWTGCVVACAAGGLAAGLAIGWFAAKQEKRAAAFGVSAAGVAALTGCLGCTVAGVTGSVAMVAGLAAASIPIVGVLHATRSSSRQA